MGRDPRRASRPVYVFFPTLRGSLPSKRVAGGEDLTSDWTAPGNLLLKLDFSSEASLAGQDEVVSTADPALLEACRRGDLSAFEELYRSHGTRMKSLAYNILGNATDAEDAVQEAFLRV